MELWLTILIISGTFLVFFVAGIVEFWFLLRKANKIAYDRDCFECDLNEERNRMLYNIRQLHIKTQDLKKISCEVHSFLGKQGISEEERTNIKEIETCLESYVISFEKDFFTIANYPIDEQQIDVVSKQLASCAFLVN